MASFLLDSIINRTIPQSFGGRKNLEETLLNLTSLQENASEPFYPTDNKDNSLTMTAAADQLDNLSQSMQNIDMSQYERLFWVLLFSLMVFIAAGGNTIVVYIVSTNKEMKSVTNYFLVNLSLADTMVSTLNVIFNFISMLNR